MNSARRMVVDRRRAVRVRRDEARRAARQLLQRYDIPATGRVEVERIAESLNAIIKDDPDLVTSDARLVCSPRVAVIRLSVPRLGNAGRRRFSIAHEIGHLVLWNGAETVSPLSCDNINHPEAREAEAEADAFAAELLMPEALVRPRCEVSPLSLDVAAAIADAFGTSIMASALRIAELTSERCAIVYSEAGVVRWSARSSTFSAYVERGAPLDRDTVAFDLARGARRAYDDGPQPIAADAWIDTPGRGGDLVEHSAIVPETGGVLSLLWVPERESWRLGMRDDD